MVFLSFCLLVVSFSGVEILFGSGVECVRLVFRFVTKDGDSNISSGCVVGSGLVSGIIVISSALLSCCKGAFAVDVVVVSLCWCCCCGCGDS